jgi:hypothetical protein
MAFAFRAASRDLVAVCWSPLNGERGRSSLFLQSIFLSPIKPFAPSLNHTTAAGRSFSSLNKSLVGEWQKKNTLSFPLFSTFEGPNRICDNGMRGMTTKSNVPVPEGGDLRLQEVSLSLSSLLALR